MPRSVVCISRALGAGGEEVGRLVAERLGFLFVDEEIIARASELGDVDPGTVADAERRKSLLERWFENLAKASVLDPGASIAATLDAPPSEAVQELIRAAIGEVAERGKTVIVAHAASHAVGADPGVLRVLLTASPQTRARRLAASNGLDEQDAAQEIKQSDAARADYLKRFYATKEEQPTQYDLVINTDTLDVDDARDLILTAATSTPPQQRP